MIAVEVELNFDLDLLSEALEKTKPLMVVWGETREALLQQQFQRQVNPEGRPLRSLSATYQLWKEQNYPGRKKRELTGRTYRSYRQQITDTELKESMSGNAVYLQNNLDLPIFPESLSNPTYAKLIEATNRYIDSVLI